MDFSKLKATTQLFSKPKSSRRPGTEPKDKLPAKKAAQPPDVPGLINGQPAGSTYEWNVARALWSLGWKFSYQVPVMGGREFRGGQVLDFLVFTVPMKTALIVNGDYWHQTDEEYAMSELMTALKNIGIEVNSEPLVLWAAQASTYESAHAYIDSKIGKG